MMEYKIDTRTDRSIKSTGAIPLKCAVTVFPEFKLNFHKPVTHTNPMT